MVLRVGEGRYSPVQSSIDPQYLEERRGDSRVATDFGRDGRINNQTKPIPASGSNATGSASRRRRLDWIFEELSRGEERRWGLVLEGQAYRDGRPLSSQSQSWSVCLVVWGG